MPRKGPHVKVGENKDAVIGALPLACADEKAAVEFFELHRWGGDVACPHCGDVSVYQMRQKDSPARQVNFRWRCNGCRKQFTVRTGSMMEDSKVPLRHWAYAHWQACASKKGVSAMQIMRQTGVSYKTALFMLHRIRFVMAGESGPMLTGAVEVDETYVGGKPRKLSSAHKAALQAAGKEVPRSKRGAARRSRWWRWWSAARQSGRAACGRG